ncbi:MAG: 2-oxoacid:acceptor oxidoreductase subunit alpha [Candidatus Omnitrophica bacterium]|nr:2-oxoacid:acceptor oxidoreductase subunit alpha [Candidatus Omnitrophota bacterium]
MKQELTIKISGEAGQGMQTIGSALCLMYKNAGLNIFADQDYMSRIRGGNNFFRLRIAEYPVYAPRRLSDILVALDKPSIGLHRGSLATDGVIILDRKKFNIEAADPAFFDVPLFELAVKAGASELFVNSVALGALAGSTGVGFSYVEAVLQSAFRDKGADIITKNVAAAQSGFDFAAASDRTKAFRLKCCQAPGSLVLSGNDAVSLAAIRAGCKFYSAYPMTPSTGIMNFLARYAARFNIVVEQAEDEIAAVNMALGASFAGVRAMTGTSGGGFALMQEGVSLSGMTETPIVIFEGQRPAPATGFPTRTEQADLNFVIHAGHGEFARAVFTPGTIEEAFFLTVKAFNLAEKYQIPVFILSDQVLAESSRNIAAPDLAKAAVERFIIPKKDSAGIKDYKRYALTASGISPRAVPSWIEGVVYADSDEHTEEGHITEDACTRTQMVEKRLHKKMAGLKKEIEAPVAGNAEGAELLLVGFGSTFGVVREAAAALNDKSVGFIHLPQVWPFPAREIIALAGKAKKLVTVENNASAQLAALLRRETGRAADSSILKFDGRPFDLDTLVEQVGREV